MADWGLLAGLGEAMKGFGNAWSDKSTAELKERLAQEREARAEQRELAKEERRRKQEESTPAEHRIERDSDGATWRVPYNKFGQPLGERTLASAQDIKDYNFEDKKRQVSLDNLVNQGVRAQEMHDANMGYRRAATSAQEALADTRLNPRARPSSGRSGSSRTSLDEVDGPVNESDLAQAMIKEYPDLFKDTGLTTQEGFDYALESIRAAQRTGKDPVLVARDAIRLYQERKKKAPQRSGGIKLGG